MAPGFSNLSIFLLMATNPAFECVDATLPSQRLWCHQGVARRFPQALCTMSASPTFTHRSGIALCTAVPAGQRFNQRARTSRFQTAEAMKGREGFKLARAGP